MSRRYGRNQKRAHRARIAELEKEAEDYRLIAANLAKASTMDRALLRKISDDNRTLRDTLEVARSVLGKDHPAFPPGEMEAFNARDGYLRYAHPPRMRDFMSVGDMTASELMDQWQRVEVMTAHAKLDECQRNIHFRVTYDGRKWGYAITRSAFEKMPKEAMVRRVAEELAMAIQQELSNNERKVSRVA